MNIKLKNGIYIFLCIFAVFIIVYTNFCISANINITIDDILNAFEYRNKSFYDIFLDNIYTGKIIGSSMVKIVLYILPSELHIHPMLWARTGDAIIKGLFYALICFQLCGFLYFNRPKTLMYPVLTLMGVGLYIYLKLYYALDNEISAFFYCFIFPFIIYFFFWNKFFKLLLQDGQKQNVFTFLTMFITSLLIGMSAECTSISAMVSLFLILIYTLISKKHRTLAGITLLGTLLGAYTYFTSQDFIKHANGKGTFIDFSQTINNAINIFPEYIQAFKRVFVHDFLGYLISIILLLLIINKLKDINKKNIINIIVTSLTLGAFAFYMSLIFAGRHVTSHYTYAEHYDLIFQIKVILIMVILFEVSFLYKYKKLYYSLIIIPYIILSTVYFPVIRQCVTEIYQSGYKNYLKQFIYSSEESKRIRYINERLLAYYTYRNIRPVLFDPNEYYVNLYWAMNYDYTKMIYDKKYTIDDITIYNNYDEAYKTYLENNGPIITEQEIEEDDYQKLLDKNFVLEGKERKSTK